MTDFMITAHNSLIHPHENRRLGSRLWLAMIAAGLLGATAANGATAPTDSVGGIARQHRKYQVQNNAYSMHGDAKGQSKSPWLVMPWAPVRNGRNLAVAGYCA